MTEGGIVMMISRFPPAVGGTEIQCKELAKTLAQEGRRVAVLTERYQPDLSAYEKLEGVEIYRFSAIGSSMLASLWYALNAWRWLRKHPEFTILHAHMMAGPAIAALLIGRAMKKPVVVKVAGAGVTGDVGTSRRFRRGRFKLWLFRRFASHVICPSEKTYQEMEQLGIRRSALRLIPNGVNTRRFHPASLDEKAAQRRSLGIRDTDLVALYVGRWAPGKGVEMVLAVWQKARTRSNFRWRLCLVVDREPADEQKALLRDLGNRVKVFIHVSDPVPYYQASDLAILLSENEGLSNFLLEAMASGLPLLTTAAAAVGPLETAERHGWVVRANDPQQVLDTLITLEQPGEAQQSKGAEARQQALTHFSIQATARSVSQVYEEAYEAL